MSEIIVKGRHASDPKKRARLFAAVRQVEGGVMVRIEDHDQTDFWIETFIPSILLVPSDPTAVEAYYRS